jgi:tetratricopeptide (TPR) repeat protein
MEQHLADEILERFLCSRTSIQESQEVVRHLLSQCPVCSEAAERLAVSIGLFERETPSTSTQAYEEVFTRALSFGTEQAERLAVDRLRAWGLWASLEPLAPQVRFSRVEADPAFHTFGLYDRLLEASRGYIRTDPAEAVDVVRLAIAVAERLDPAVLGRERISDLRAGGFAALGNAKRLASDFEGSRRAFNEAWRILEEEGTNEPAERAHLIGLESGYMQDMGEFETAESALEEALTIYRSNGDSHLAGRTLLKMGDCIGQLHPERGIARIREAIVLMDVTKEPRLDLCARHDLAWFLNDAGRPEEALAVLEAARALYKQFPDRWTQLRLHWLEGRIAASLGDLTAAESIFGQLWEEFRSRDLNHELVLVSIDLAEVLVRNGEPNRAAELITQCYPIMAAWGLHRYALSAWILFEDAVREERAGSIYRRLREYYLRHWVKPEAFQ